MSRKQVRSSASHLRPVSSSSSDWTQVARKGERAAPVRRCLLVLCRAQDGVWSSFGVSSGRPAPGSVSVP